jgi:hypothetical protein
MTQETLCISIAVTFEAKRTNETKEERRREKERKEKSFTMKHVPRLKPNFVSVAKRTMTTQLFVLKPFSPVLHRLVFAMIIHD